MINLRAIRLLDFLSHKATTLDFEDGDKVLLDGVSGSGKSSIIDALIWALYGVGRVENRFLVRKGAKIAKVSVELFDTETGFRYVIDRTADVKGKHTIAVFQSTEDPEVLNELGTGGVKDTQKYIERELLHASYELFINSAAYPQGNRESFVNATSARRKELLLEILKTEDIAMYADMARERVKKLDGEILQKGADIIAADTQIKAHETRLEFKKGFLVDKEKHSKEVDTLQAEVDLKRAAYDKLTFANENREKALSLRSQENDLYQRIGKLLVQAFGGNMEKPNPAFLLPELEARLKQEEADLAALPDEAEIDKAIADAMEWAGKRNALLADRPSIRDYESDITELEARLLRHVKEQPECPSGDNCPYMLRLQPEEAYLKDEIAKKQAAEAKQTADLGAWQLRMDELAEAPQMDAIQATKRFITEAKEAIRKTKSQIDTIKVIDDLNADALPLSREAGALEVALPSDEVITKAREELGTAQELLAHTRALLATAEGNLAHLASLEGDIEGLKKKNLKDTKDVAELKEKHEMFMELREAFGTNGVQAVALDYLLPALEDKVNEVLSQLSDFRIRLDTQKASASGDTQIEGLFITIRNDQGEEFSYDSYSGGEKLKITVAISEALASLQKVGFRILDELFVGLDEDSTESFAEVLSQVQSRFSQMLCISHLRTIKDLFEKQVVITKLDGVSTATI